MRAANVCLIGLVFVVSVSAEPLLEGQVRLESGEPVADAQVRLFDLSDLRQGAIARAMTDGTGYFALPLAAQVRRALPARFALGPNYPNPFNPSTIIPYQLAASSAVRLEVFNLLGQRITTLVDGERPAGFHTATWHATDGAGRAAGAGVYIYRMTVGVENQTGRMVLLDGQAGVSAGGAASVMPGASGIGGSDGADAQVYGLIVSGSGLVPYVDSAFRVESGMAPVELVVSSGQYSAGKTTDDDCAFCDLFGTFNDQQEEEEEDLIVFASVSDNSLTPGQAFTLRARVQNQGTDEFQDLVLSYYRSSDATISAQDMLLGTDEVGSLAASSTSGNESISLTASSTSGSYYYGACVASVSDEGDTFNYCSTGVRVIVADEEDQVSIPDANLRAAIEAALGKARGAPITVAEMETLTNLKALRAGISDLTGLEFATNLTELYLWANNISDVSALSGLTNLIGLNLSLNDLTDAALPALSGLTNLRELELNANYVSDLSPLSGLTNLRDLYLGSNGISDVSALSGLTNLRDLYLGFNQISDVSALSGLTNLTDLYLRRNNLTDAALPALSGLTNLRALHLGINNLTDAALPALSGLTNLRELGLDGNNLTDAALPALSGLTNLTWLGLESNNLTDAALPGLSSRANLQGLFLSGNNISDVSPLSSLTNLQWLFLSANNISDISPLSGLTNLIGLNLSLNNLTDVSVLAGLTNLWKLRLAFNLITDVSALRGLYSLTELDLRGNPLSDSSINDDIPAVESNGTTVRFDAFRTGEFDIELVFPDSFTEKQKNWLQYAARRWMSVITEDLPDYEFTQGWPGQCGDQSYAIPSGERIDDLRIYITSFDGGGEVFGWGGPHLLREETHLPVLGCMGFDLKRANLLITGLHEMGHVLGFGPVWDEFGFRQDYSQDDPSADTHFNGPLAIAAFDDAGGLSYTGKKVPVEKMDGSHWRGNVLEGEIMGPGGGPALSAITVQSLADLGYGVDVTQADAYTLPGAAAKASAKIAALPSISGYGMGISQADHIPCPVPTRTGKGGSRGACPCFPGTTA